MSAMEDLNNAVTALGTGFVQLDSAIQAEVAALTIALASNDTVAVQQAATNIAVVVNKMAVDAAALTASIPAATNTPAPSPAPTQPMSPTVSAPVMPTVLVTDPSATPPTQ